MLLQWVALKMLVKWKQLDKASMKFCYSDPSHPRALIINPQGFQSTMHMGD